MNKVAILLLFFLGFQNIYSQTVTYTSGSGNFVVPCDVTSITVEIWGGGGAGGAADNNSNGGSGGGAGGYSSATLTVTAGSSIAYSVGTGGRGGGNNGGNGTVTTFGGLTANGGNGGVQNQGAIGTGGTASGGSSNITGNSGGQGTTALGAAGGNANGTGGGTGGGAITGASINGNNGSIPGGGGGGALRISGAAGRTGGNGARGEIRITYTTSLFTYCAPAFTTGMEPITNVTFAGINNTTSNVAGGTIYIENFCNTATVQQGQTVPISVKGNTAGNFTNFFRLYVDWNKSGIFGDVANEIYDLGTIINSTGVDAIVLNTNITVPATANLGLTRMRIMKRYVEYSTEPCQIGAGYGQAEDYNVNVTSPPPCTTPTAQPTALTFNTLTSTSLNGSFTAASPAPSGYLIVRSTNATPPTLTNGVNYTVGTTTLTPGTTRVIQGSDITSNAVSFSDSGLTASTIYYYYIYSYNNNCTGTPPLYLTVSPLSGSTTTLAPGYCIPTGNLDCSTSNDNIANVTINTLNNNSNCSSGGYTNYPATGTQTTSLTRGNTYNLSIRTGTGNKKHGLAVWIDFNQNLSFADADEYFFIGNGVNANTTNTIAIAIPGGALLGNTRMRVRYGRQTDVSSTSSCTMGGTRGETEDYTLTIIDPIVCVAPTAQPTNLILTPNSTAVTGNFTAANPVPNNYLVVISTSSIPPSPGPNNTTSYLIGSTVTAGYTVVDNDANTTFVTSTALSTSTTYYFYIYSFNSACSGGPIYNSVSPLSGSTTTLSSQYCIPSVSNTYEADTYFSEVSFVGTLNDFTNYSTFSSSPRGYQDFTGLTNIASQAQGEGVNVSIATPYLSFFKAWVDWNRDGIFADPGERVYTSGNTGIYSTTFGFVIPSTTPVGNYRIRLRLNDSEFGNSAFNPCENIANWGETEDYLFTVVSRCSAIVATVTDGKTCGPGTVVVGATASAGVTQYRWYTTPSGSTLVGTSSTGTWTTPSITTTTTYYVTVFNGCESLVRTPVVAIINPLPNLTYSPTNPTFCGEDAILDLSVTGDKEEVYLINEKFNSGTGTFTNTNILTSASDAFTQWQNKTSTFVPTLGVWFPAISSGINNTFAYTTSDITATTVHNQLASATVNTTNFTNLTLSLNMYYSHYRPDGVSGERDYVTIDVSTDGGETWPASGEIKRYIEDVGIGTRFETQTFDLSAYINQSNLKIRVRYYAIWSDGVAIDDIKLYGDRPITTALSWTSSTTIDAYTNIACTPAYAYIPGTPALNIYVKPSLAQLELSSYSFTANATLANGCTTSQVISVTNNSKIWNGTDSYWDDDENWLPLGKPTASSCIIIPDVANDPIISNTPTALGYNLSVQNNAQLTINEDKNLIITDKITVQPNGIFTVNNSANLIQINDSAVNTGSISYKRIAPNIKGSDYVYWSSPVNNQDIGIIYDDTFPYNSGFKYQWNTTLTNTNGANGNISQGQWETASGNMTMGRGYIIRGSSSYGMPFSDIPTTFIGVPFNGTIPYTVHRGSYTGDDYYGSNGAQITNLDDNYNLIGNPYPSSINALKFLQTNTYNVSTNPTGYIKGYVKLWTHGTDPGQGVNNPFYGSFQYNYNANDYLTINFLGASKPGYDNIIRSGQGFFVQTEDGLTGSGTVNFNNSMRYNATFVPYSNSGFFKNANTVNSEFSIERHRIWLDLVDSNSQSSRILVGYAADATNEYDNLFDAPTAIPSGLKLFSTITNDTNIYEIQGRSLPFDINDEIPIGIKVTTQGNYSFAIAALDGLFEGQNIYLKDTLLNTTHDLKASPYTFTTPAGITSDRFKIVYINNALGNPSYSIDNAIKVLVNNEVAVSSSNLQMESIEVFNVLGQKLQTYNNINVNYFTLLNLHKNNTTLLLRIKLQTGETVIEKIIY